MLSLETSEFLDLVVGMELTQKEGNCDREREATKQNVGWDVSVSMCTHPVS